MPRLHRLHADCEEAAGRAFVANLVKLLENQAVSVADLKLVLNRNRRPWLLPVPLIDAVARYGASKDLGDTAEGKQVAELVPFAEGKVSLPNPAATGALK